MEVKEFEMPDGSKVSVPEEKWELINEYTVSENCTSLTINRDSNNQSFNLKKILVRARILPTDEESVSYTVKADFDSEHSYGWGGKVNLCSAPKSSETASYCEIIAECNNGVFMTYNQRQGFNNTSVNNMLVYKQVYGLTDTVLDENLKVGNISKIDMFKVTALSPIIGQGSIIKIWGVRA